MVEHEAGSVSEEAPSNGTGGRSFLLTRNRDESDETH